MWVTSNKPILLTDRENQVSETEFFSLSITREMAEKGIAVEIPNTPTWSYHLSQKLITPVRNELKAAREAKKYWEWKLKERKENDLVREENKCLSLMESLYLQSAIETIKMATDAGVEHFEESVQTEAVTPKATPKKRSTRLPKTHQPVTG